MVCAVLLIGACGESGNQSQLELSDTGIEADGETVCTPSCEGSQCGSDGCGGSCGECEPGLFCNAINKCEPISCTEHDECDDGLFCHPATMECSDCVVHSDCPEGDTCNLGKCIVAEICTSSLDCPGDEICHPDKNVCVECAGDEDCPGNHICTGDDTCREVVPCSSDKDCKSFMMVCEKSAGHCVDCLEDIDCPDWQYCFDRICITDSCWTGESFCYGQQVVQCNESGSEFIVAETCAIDEFCEEAACHDMICIPEEIWCDGDTLNQCDKIGKAVESQTDCLLNDQVCMDNECLTLVCTPDTMFCENDTTAAVCAADGQSYSTSVCAEAHYCDAGDCHPWVCVPSMKICLGDIASHCNDKGSYELQLDCTLTDQFCKDGECADHVCEPGVPYCIDSQTPAQCDPDGFSYQSGICPPDTFCDTGDCLPQQCVPDSKYCFGSITQVCTDDGSGPTDVAIDCSDIDGFCVDGECVDCIPDCTGTICGSDGCDGSCGTCVGNEECDNGSCVCPGPTCGNTCCTGISVCNGSACCTPDCFGKECGANGCGGSCGVCGGKQACVGGICECAPDCTGKDCGDDGCGGSCGDCENNQWCIAGKCPPPGADCADGNNEPWDGCKDYGVAEFILTDSGTGDQTRPSVAAVPGGGYVVAWEGSTASGQRVFWRFFPANGAVPGPTVETSMPGGGYAQKPDIAICGTTTVVLAWENYQAVDGSGRSVSARSYGLDGVPISNAAVVNTYTSGDQDSVAVTRVGTDRVVLAWDSDNKDSSGSGVAARILSCSAQSVGAEFPVNTYVIAAQHSASVTQYGSNQFVIAWTSLLQDGASGGVYGQRFNTDGGKIGNEFILSKVTANNQVNPVLSGSSNQFLAAWDSYQQDGDGWGSYFRRFDTTGSALDSNDVQVAGCSVGTQNSVAVSTTQAGAVVATWTAAQGGFWKVMHRRFNASGLPAGEEVVVSAANLQEAVRPKVSYLADGGYVIVWSASGYDNDSGGVVALRYSAEGIAQYK
jgi:hypothetical protein